MNHLEPEGSHHFPPSATDGGHGCQPTGADWGRGLQEGGLEAAEATGAGRTQGTRTEPAAAPSTSQEARLSVTKTQHSEPGGVRIWWETGSRGVTKAILLELNLFFCKCEL